MRALFIWPQGATIIVLVIFLITQKQSIAEFLHKLQFRYKNKNVVASTPPLQETQEEKVVNEDDIHHITQRLTQLGITSYDDFESFMEGLIAELQLKSTERKQYTEKITHLLDLTRYYEYSYLNLLLVPHSKVALLFFKNTGPITKTLFMLTFVLPPEVVDQQTEKEAIFNVLLQNDLIEVVKQDLFQLSHKGTDFLRSINYIER